jgi:hypothetical protein
LNFRKFKVEKCTGRWQGDAKSKNANEHDEAKGCKMRSKEAKEEQAE